MNPDVKEKWLEALRSGKYKQGTGALNKDGRFCCLGVLCDLFAEDDDCNGAWQELDENALTFKPDGRPGRHAFLPDAVAEWAGIEISPSDPFVSDDNDETLSQLNDSGRTFRQIADIIEEEL